MKSVTVVIEETNTHTSCQITLYSKFTAIYGQDSAEGKSHFINYIIGLDVLESLKVTVSDDYDFIPIGIDTTQEAIKVLIQRTKKTVFLIDEYSVLNEVQGLANHSSHLFITVVRAVPPRLDYPMIGMYRIVDDSNMFDIVPVEPLPVADFNRDTFDSFVTESNEGRSEHQLLSSLTSVNLIAARGRDRIEKVLRKPSSGGTLVFADLGCIGRAYKLLLKRAKNKNIKFFDYICFEELLYNSQLVKNLGRQVDEDTNLNFFSLERFYESLLEQITKDTSLAYSHKNPKLADEYLNSDNSSLVLPKEFYEYLKSRGL